MKYKVVVFFVFILLFGITLRLYQIATQSYWLDEMFSLYIAKQSGWNSLTWDSNPFLYHFLLRYWVQLWGENEFFVRLLSSLFSLGSATTMYFVGKKLGGIKLGLAVMTLALLHPVSIEYAQEARMYALLELLTALNLYFFLFVSNERKYLIGWIVTLILLSLTHLFSFFVIIAEVFWWFHRRNNKATQKYFWAVSLFVLAGFLIVVKTTGLDVRFLDWQKLRYDINGPATDLLKLLSVPGMGSAWGCLLIPLLIWTLPKTQRNQILNEQSFQFLLGTVAFSIAMAFLFSLALERTFLLPRYFIFLIPFVALIYSLLVEKAWQQKGRHRALAVFVSLGLLSGTALAWTDIYKYKKAPWRNVAQYIYHIRNPIVLTTRSQTIQTPYFERYLIPVRKWTPDELGLQEITDLVEAQNNVFIVENYWGGLLYWENVKALMTQKSYKINEQIFKVGESEELYLMQIRKN